MMKEGVMEKMLYLDRNHMRGWRPISQLIEDARRILNTEKMMHYVGVDGVKYRGILPWKLTNRLNRLGWCVPGSRPKRFSRSRWSAAHYSDMGFKIILAAVNGRATHIIVASEGHSKIPAHWNIG